MVSAIIELGIGYFITYKVSGILELKGYVAKCVKLVGIIILLLGFVSLVEGIAAIIPSLAK